jgi:hypothetical protein
MVEQREDQEQAEKRNKKQEWEASFEQDIIDLRGLPDMWSLKHGRF